MTTSPSATEGDRAVASPSGRLQAVSPVAASMARRLPSAPPEYTNPSDTAGEAPARAPTERHTSAPESASSAYRLPSAEPTYTTPSTTAGDEDTASPAVKCQRSVPSTV